MHKADFVENLAEILPSQDSDDWERILSNSPEIYWMLMREFEAEVIQSVREHAGG